MMSGGVWLRERWFLLENPSCRDRLLVGSVRVGDCLKVELQNSMKTWLVSCGTKVHLGALCFLNKQILERASLYTNDKLSILAVSKNRMANGIDLVIVTTVKRVCPWFPL